MTDAFTIKKAVRQAAPITAALIGDSGSGKTYSALMLARGLVGDQGKIVLIDTEGGRSLVYSDIIAGGFEHLDFTPPYSPERMSKAVQHAVEQGADAIIIDSASDEWEGEEGVLDMATAEAERIKAHDLRMWKMPKIAHRKFIQKATKSPCHVILCYRKTVSLSMERDDRGKMQPTETTSIVWDKKDKFYLQMAFEIDREHKVKCLRLPEPYKAYIQDGDVLTVEHGKKFHSESQVGAMETAPTPHPEPTRDPSNAEPPPEAQAEPEQPTAYEIKLASGDPMLFSDLRALVDWLKQNISKIKTAEQLTQFEERNKADFDKYFAPHPDMAQEKHQVIQARKAELNGTTNI